ncbi:MAG TPA: hypothetical protein PKX42_17085 [Polaromonas sp.]|jgi:hypothetical protein|nr:hypothetical protein [Polaromonas sp.]
MLRAASRQKIIGLLESTYFGIDNYSVEFTGTDDRIVLITFLPDPKFSFQILARNDSANVWCIEAPGSKFLTPETIGISSFESGVNRLIPWTERIREELIAVNPFAKEISELKAHVEERLANLGEELSGFFSREEANSLNEKLAEFSARLTDIAERNSELEEAMNVLKKTVSDLQEAASTINRGTWYRMAGGRLLTGLKVLGKSKEAREFALEAAKKFLLEGPK